MTEEESVNPFTDCVVAVSLTGSTTIGNDRNFVRSRVRSATATIWHHTGGTSFLLSYHTMKLSGSS